MTYYSAYAVPRIRASLRFGKEGKEEQRTGGTPRVNTPMLLPAKRESLLLHLRSERVGAV
jgi:hypothetical protein